MRTIAAFLVAALASSATAGETAWQEIAPGSKARLISSDIVRPDGKTVVGLELDLPQGTNTYWRVPGETGIPTMFDFSRSHGVAGHDVLWPYPSIETHSGYVDFVYRGATVLPVELTLDGTDAEVEVTVVMGICSDICVPANVSFALSLAADPDRAQDLRLAQAIARSPLPWTGPGEAFGAVFHDAFANVLVVELDADEVDPLSLIVDAGSTGPLFGAPQKSPDGNLVHLPFIGGEDSRDVEGMPVRLTFMTTMGPFTLERRIASAGSTAAGD